MKFNFTTSFFGHFARSYLFQYALLRCHFFNPTFFPQLSAWPGVDAYAKSDIPDHFGFRDNDLVLDVLIVSRDRAKIGTTYEYAEKFLPEANPGDGSESVFFFKKSTNN